MVIYFDTETTGLKPGHVIQLAYILDDGKNIRGKNFYFCVPYISEESVAVHGITVEKLKELSGGRTFFEYLEEIDDDFRSADLTVAHNFPFDFNFMTSEFSAFSRIFHYKEKFDTMRFFTSYTAIKSNFGGGYKYPKLSELAEFFDIYDYDVSRFSLKVFNGGTSGHDARFDVSETCLIVKKAMEKYADFKEMLQKYY